MWVVPQSPQKLTFSSDGGKASLWAPCSSCFYGSRGVLPESPQVGIPLSHPAPPHPLDCSFPCFFLHFIIAQKGVGVRVSAMPAESSEADRGF